MQNNIRNFRFLANMSQSALAKKTGVSRETINRVESNKSNPSLELAYKIAKSLNTNIEDIFHMEEKKILQ
ncbi:MAG: helix-turn-helix transcriptional regulator [Clostridiales bacterium]